MSGTSAQLYEFGRFRVDARKRLLLDYAGKTLPLTPKAFDTLLFLLENRASIVTKAELMRAVWPSTVVEENNLNQCISAVRRVLGDTREAHQFIVTVPGRGYRFVAEVNPRSAAREQSAESVSALAVLPFIPLVAEHRDPALELGMADTLIARLSNIRQIVVRPISSVRRYAGADQDSRMAGRELAVDSIVEGSIQRWGDAIRVTARLMQVSTGTALWSGTFEEKFSSIFEVQDAICERIAAALALQLRQEDRQQLKRRYTDNPEVYELYLKGRLHFMRLTPPEMLTGLGYFQSALALDPEYALAWLGLGSIHFRLPLAGELNPAEHYPKARAAAQRALEIDDRLAEGHAILGWVKFWHEWNWAEAEGCFLRALEIDPNDTESHLGYAHLLSNTGRHEEALQRAQRARKLSPLLLVANALEGQFLLHAGRIDEAGLSLRRTRALDDHFWLTHMYLSNVHCAQGEFEAAVDAANRAMAHSGGGANASAALAWALAGLGKRDEARMVLNALLDRAAQRYVPPYSIALIYNSLGDRANARDYLQRAVELRDPGVTFLKVEPKWRNLRDAPEFVELTRRVGL